MADKKKKMGGIKKGASAIKNRRSRLEEAEQAALGALKTSVNKDKKTIKEVKFKSEMDRLRGIKK